MIEVKGKEGMGTGARREREQGKRRESKDGGRRGLVSTKERKPVAASEQAIMV